MSSEARTLYDSGQLEAAIESLIGSVKANPGDTLQRTFLFELLCFAGQWDRAEMIATAFVRRFPAATDRDIRTLFDNIRRHTVPPDKEFVIVSD